MIDPHFYWPEMRKNTLSWCQAYPRCQACKISRGLVSHCALCGNYEPPLQEGPAPSRQQALYRKGFEQLNPCLGEKQRAKTLTLSPLYNGPFDAVSRHDKYFTIGQGGYLDNVTVDRLKAFLEYPTVELDEVLSDLAQSDEDEPIENVQLHPYNIRRRPRPDYVAMNGYWVDLC